jgi:hypothetical protein
MSRQEAIHNLGTIARSGTKEFVQRAEAAQARKTPPAAPIGHLDRPHRPVRRRLLFGSFMVGRATSPCITRQAPAKTAATLWHLDRRRLLYRRGRRPPRRIGHHHHPSSCAPPTKRTNSPTSPSDWDLALHPSRNTPTSSNTPSSWRTKVRRRAIPTTTKRAPSRPIAEDPAEKVVSWQVVNSMKAHLDPSTSSEVTPDEYSEFYKHVSRDWEPPAGDHDHFKAEGAFEYFALLLFVPPIARRMTCSIANSQVRPAAPREPRAGHGALPGPRCPTICASSSGVVDSPDLSFNVSREMLQQDRRVKANPQPYL